MLQGSYLPQTVLVWYTTKQSTLSILSWAIIAKWSIGCTCEQLAGKKEFVWTYWLHLIQNKSQMNTILLTVWNKSTLLWGVYLHNMDYWSQKVTWWSWWEYKLQSHHAYVKMVNRISTWSRTKYARKNTLVCGVARRSLVRTMLQWRAKMHVKGRVAGLSSRPLSLSSAVWDWD